jgi:hypothetical protein
MEIQKVKDILVTIILVVCVVSFVFFIGISSYNLYKFTTEHWQNSSQSTDGTDSIPNITSSCTQFDDTYMITIGIDSFSKEMKNVKCRLINTGGMVADKEEIVIERVSPHSSELCDFNLKGSLLGPTIRVRVSYLLKSWIGYKEYSTVLDAGYYCKSFKSRPSPTPQVYPSPILNPTPLQRIQ